MEACRHSKEMAGELRTTQQREKFRLNVCNANVCGLHSVTYVDLEAEKITKVENIIRTYM